MPCQCEEKQCLEIFADLCAPWVQLPIEAEESGQYIINVEFNGVNQRREFTAVEGDKFIVPNLFNGDYRHAVTFYAPDGTVTCYTIKTMASTWSIPLPAPPTPAIPYELFLTLAIGDAPELQNGLEPDYFFNNGTTFVVPDLIGAKIIDLRQGMISVAPEAGGYSFDSSTGTITFDNPVYDSNIYIEAIAGPAVITSYLTTEASEPILTESGDNIIY